MKIENIDHIVLITAALEPCLHFYTYILGMKHVEWDGRHALSFGVHKFNIHTRKGEFQPAAKVPEYGSLDVCLIVEDDIHALKAEIERKGWPVELGPVTRHGALGEMQSLYLRDPDGNLIELAHYV